MGWCDFLAIRFGIESGICGKFDFLSIEDSEISIEVLK